MNIVSLITGRDKRGSYGTGFVIHKNENKRETYLMTCDHVIDAVGGEDQVKVNHHYDAEVVARGRSRGCDLAIIKVGRLLKAPIIRPSKIISKQLRITIDGYHCDTEKEFSTRRISSYLGTQSFIHDESFGDILKWTLNIDESSDRLLEEGCSGAPAIISSSLDEQVHKVIGVVYKMEYSSKVGFAISIKEGQKICRPPISRELEPVWSALHPSMLPLIKSTLRTLIKYADNQITKLSYQRQKHSPELQNAFEWLSTRAILAADAVDDVLEKFPELIGGWIEGFESEDFQWELERYIECVYVALIDDCVEILENLSLPPSQRCYPQAYDAAFNYLKQRIPSSLDDSIYRKISDYFEKLNQSIQSDLNAER